MKFIVHSIDAYSELSRTTGGPDVSELSEYFSATTGATGATGEARVNPSTGGSIVQQLAVQHLQ